MFLFFKPPQSQLQVQLLDPDGPKQKPITLEEEYVLALFKQRAPKRRRKVKTVSFKEKILQQLEAGKTTVEIANNLATELIAAEPAFVFTDEIKADVDKILAEYKRQVAKEIQDAIVQELAALQKQQEQVNSQYQQLADAYKQAEIDLAVAKEARRKRILKAKKIKILMLLATLDDEHD